MSFPGLPVPAGRRGRAVKGDLRGILRARRLSRAATCNIRQNLFFAAAMKLNGVLVPLQAAGAAEAGGTQYLAPGTRVTVRPLGDEADWRVDAGLVGLDAGLTVGYRGFYGCGKT